MLNFVAEGKTLKYKNAGAADVKSGQAVAVGSVLAVAATDIPVGGVGALALRGVYLLPKAAGAVTQGQTLYFDPDGDPVGGVADSGCLTTVVAAGQVVAGFAYKDAGAADATVACCLTPGA